MLWNVDAQPVWLGGTLELVSQRPLNWLLESDDLSLRALPALVVDDDSDLRGVTRRPECRNDGTNNGHVSSLVCVRLPSKTGLQPRPLLGSRGLQR